MPDVFITYCRRELGVVRGRGSLAGSALTKKGVQVRQVGDGRLDLDPDRILWIEGNASWFPRVCRQLIATPKAQRPFVVLWHCEPLPPPAASGLPRPRLYWREVAKILLRDLRATDVYTNARCLRWLAGHGLPDLLVVTTLIRQEFLAECGIRAHRVAIGCDSWRGHDMGLERDIDVVFLGTLDIPHRKRNLKLLRGRGVNVQAMGSYRDPAYWNENRTRLLNRTKIMLNLTRSPGDTVTTRLLLGMANKVLMISEPMYKPAPYVAGKHFVVAPIEEMPDVICYYLAHDEERERIAEAGHRFVEEELTLESSVSRILELICARRGQPRRDAALSRIDAAVVGRR